MADRDGLVDSITGHLFANPESNVYAILDGASVPDLLDVLYSERPQFECLYRGELKPDMAEVAPYLVRLESESSVTRWVIGHGWGNHWGIFAATALDMGTTRRHFRRFLIVHDPDGKPMYFRYYDPRVLRTYLPTCNSEELETMVGPVEWFLVEGEDDATALRFEIQSGALKQRQLALRRR